MEGCRLPEVLCDNNVWGTAQGALGVWGEAITIQLVLCIFLEVRAVKGADADEVLFVG
jgi:hypothetical protein